MFDNEVLNGPIREIAQLMRAERGSMGISDAATFAFAFYGLAPINENSPAGPFSADTFQTILGVEKYDIALQSLSNLIDVGCASQRMKEIFLREGIHLIRTVDGNGKPCCTDGICQIRGRTFNILATIFPKLT